MKHKLFFIIFAIFIFAIGSLWFFAYGCQSDWCRVLPVNLKPVFGPTPDTVVTPTPVPIVNTSSSASAQNETGLPLSIPDGFRVETSVTADNPDINNPRVLRFGPGGSLWTSLTREGKIAKINFDMSGGVESTQIVHSRLNRPHGIAFSITDPNLLYIAEEHRLVRTDITDDEKKLEHILDLPSGGNHYTRTIGFGPDGNLYISIGSTCNVCYEKDDRRSTVMRYNPTTGESKIYAEGLRNAVFFTWDSIFGDMWATEMGRDLLGDNTPPDEINIVKEGAHYGWPVCYGKNIHDSEFDKNVYVRNPCADYEPSTIDLQAHSAPLGLAFVPEEGWPEDWWYDLIVAYHGSWNRSVPTGYKLVRFKFDSEMNFEGREDFITGWLRGDGSSLGRPVDVLIQPGGVMYVSDDKRGAIYKISYIGELEY